MAFLLFFSQLHVYMDVSLYACLTGRTPCGTANGTRQFTVSWRGKQFLHCDFFFFHPSAELGLLNDVVMSHRGECKSDRVWSTPPAVACRLIFSMRLRQGLRFRSPLILVFVCSLTECDPFCVDSTLIALPLIRLIHGIRVFVTECDPGSQWGCHV